ncbi:MAG: hypothetical protein LBT79_06600 [Elusimicrobiota bacterium]|nr:hypothetical protein [Elusimicrobiota bacterium]
MKKQINKMILEKGILVSASIPVYFFSLKKDSNKLIYAECPALKIFSYGKNISHAKKMFKEAYECWLEFAIENGITNELKGLGWKLTKSTAFPRDDTFIVPIELLGSQNVNFTIPLGA